MKGQIRELLAKKFFVGLPDGVFITSNILNSLHQPILAEYVLPSGPEREDQWRSIVLRGCNHRICNVFENKKKAIAGWNCSFEALDPASANDTFSLSELMDTGLTGLKSMSDLRARAEEGFLFIPPAVLFARIRLFDGAQSIVRLKAAYIIKSRHPELTWNLLAKYISCIRFSEPLSMNPFYISEVSLKEIVNLVVDTVTNLLIQDDVVCYDNDKVSLIDDQQSRLRKLRKRYKPLITKKLSNDDNSSQFAINLSVRNDAINESDINLNELFYLNSKKQKSNVPSKNHLSILQKGADEWNSWRRRNPGKVPKLCGADLHGIDLRSANLSRANLVGADLSYANLRGADLRCANLNDANLTGAILETARLKGADVQRGFLRGADLDGVDARDSNFTGAILRETSIFDANLSNAILCDANVKGAGLNGAELQGANLRGANFLGSDISNVNFSGADLTGAKLCYSTIVRSNFENAKLTSCHIFGISAWDVKTNNHTEQKDLIITPDDQSSITIDNIETAQFVYLLLRNDKIRDAIDTIAKKGVLILGRFTKERKAVLDAIRERLRELDFIPILFDFEKPTQRDFTETIKVLAGLSLFIIADISNPKSSPLELQATVPNYMIPLVPICDDKEEPFSMFIDLKNKYSDWVLDVLFYDSATNLIKVINEAIIEPALEMANILKIKKNQPITKRHIKDYS